MAKGATVETTERKRIGELRLIWGMAARYPRRVAAALAAVAVSSSATLAIPYGFSRVIDRGFIAGGGNAAQVATAFHYLLKIGRASCRERV